ncbi:hypothetical protein HZH68_016479 [Vespula germanica]|uniref:Uncharacterized protein n=1 Tax=Vespula germanica TaxID=30212 RepID=A0A834MR54_VESGE|nr:hypothetical protein HZH68_016479 [Vespula germanica]
MGWVVDGDGGGGGDASDAGGGGRDRDGGRKEGRKEEVEPGRALKGEEDRKRKKREGFAYIGGTSSGSVSSSHSLSYADT